METNTIHTRWTDENILDLITRLRNYLIKDFLDERVLKEYIAAQFGVRELNNIRIELIKKDLKELLSSPVNTHHYQRLIEDIKQNDSASLTEHNDILFYKELESLLKKSIY